MVTSELVALARAGDPRAFEEIVWATNRQAYTLALRIVRDRQEAEDVTQEAYLRALRGLPGFREDASFETWLYRIVANCSVDLIRARKSRRIDGGIDDLEAAPELPSVQGPERLARSAELRGRVDLALSDLSPLERAAFTLRHGEGRSIHEIGKTLGLGTSATKHSVFRAVRKLRAALEPLRREL